MRKKYSIYILVLLLIGISACKKERDPYFLITSDQAGLLQRNIPFEEVEKLYQNDSIVKDTLQLALGVGNGKFKVYERGGKHLLTITPGNDSVQNIEHILIADPRFTTMEGIGLQSTFKDIKEKYEIDKILTSLNNVVVLIKDSDIYFTIDKQELPAHLRYTKTRDIELVEIPDQAKLKYFMLGWD